MRSCSRRSWWRPADGAACWVQAKSESQRRPSAGCRPTGPTGLKSDSRCLERTNLSARLDVAGFAEDVAREMSARREGGRRQASGEGVLLALSAWVAPFAAPFETYAAVDVFVGPMAATPLGESRTGSAA